MSTPETVTSPSPASDAALAAELRVGVMRLRRRLAVERHPANDLSLPAMAVLGLLAREDQQTIGELARSERVQPPSMTRTVNCLEDLGLVERRADPRDGRCVVVSLSEHGRGVVLADRDRRDAWLARRLAELPPDQRDLVRQVVPLLHQLSISD
ncbi:MAG: MarR family transcriptional regulator [Nocardioides sp.]|jgi:DNA-binding MarR family transcriptional regulator